MRQLLTDFYQEAAHSSDLTPLFADQYLEQDHQGMSQRRRVSGVISKNTSSGQQRGTLLPLKPF